MRARALRAWALLLFLIVSIKVKTLKMLSTLTDRLTDRKTDVSIIFHNPESPTQTLLRLVNNTLQDFFKNTPNSGVVLPDKYHHLENITTSKKVPLNL